MAYTINLAKENFKFSGTHFTIFSKTEAERMHGHNYQVSVRIHINNQLDPKLGFAFDFNTVKPILKSICDELDEYILIPKLSPYLKIDTKAEQIIVQFGEKTYSLPQTDVRLLPIVNVTVEELARYICERFAKNWKNQPANCKLYLTVQETRGQSVTYHQELSEH